MLLLLSIVSIIFGYYLLSVSPEALFDEVVKRAWSGIILTLIGGIMMIIYIYRRSK